MSDFSRSCSAPLCGTSRNQRTGNHPLSSSQYGSQDIMPASHELNSLSVCLKDPPSNVLTETHFQTVLPSRPYWNCEYPYPKRHSALIHGDSNSDADDSRGKKRRSPSMAQRRAANIRERKRMLNLNEAFDVLRRRVPTFNYERRLSRIETLRLAMSYISFMTQILNGTDPSEAKIDFVKPAISVKLDKELRENLENRK